MDKVEEKVLKRRGELPPEALEPSVRQYFKSLFGVEPSYYRFLAYHKDNIKNLWFIVEVDGFRVAIPSDYVTSPHAWNLAESKNPLLPFTTSRYEDFDLDGISDWHLKRRAQRKTKYQMG